MVDLAQVRGVAVGHAEDPEASSGVTAVLFDSAVPAVVEVRGGASATYDTASLSLDSTFGRRWALFFAGGSLYGLDAARGVRLRVLERGGGHRAFRNPNLVAPVSGAALFDLPRTKGPIPDYLPLGYEAARRASRAEVPVGRVGAGVGATVGKYLGRDRAMHGGVGTAAARFGRRGILGVLLVVNAIGAVRDPSTGRWVAGARGNRGRVEPPGAGASVPEPTSGTTLGLVVTDLTVDRPTLSPGRRDGPCRARLGGDTVPQRHGRGRTVRRLDRRRRPRASRSSAGRNRGPPRVSRGRARSPGCAGCRPGRELRTGGLGARAPAKGCSPEASNDVRLRDDPLKLSVTGHQDGGVSAQERGEELRGEPLVEHGVRRLDDVPNPHAAGVRPRQRPEQGGFGQRPDDAPLVHNGQLRIRPALHPLGGRRQRGARFDGDEGPVHQLPYRHPRRGEPFLSL